MNYDLMDFMDGLRRSDSVDNAGQNFVNLAQKTGASVVHMFFGTKTDSTTVSTLPEAFIRAEVSEPTNKKEQVVQAIQSGEPRVFWGVDLDREYPERNEIDYAANMRRFENFRQRSSVTFSMPDADQTFSGAGVGIGFEDVGEAFTKRMDECGGAFAIAAYAAYSQMLRLSLTTPSPLSARQSEILQLLANGHKLGEVADKMKISDSAVNQYLATIRTKLHVRTKEEALAKAVMHGWVIP